MQVGFVEFKFVHCLKVYNLQLRTVKGFSECLLNQLFKTLGEIESKLELSTICFRHGMIFAEHKIERFLRFGHKLNSLCFSLQFGAEGSNGH